MASQIELEKLLDAGERLGLMGTDLKEWVDEQREILKQERDDERNERAKQRALEQQERELEKVRQDKLKKRTALRKKGKLKWRLMQRRNCWLLNKNLSKIR